jgi:hypothetical protein
LSTIRHHTAVPGTEQKQSVTPSYSFGYSDRNPGKLQIRKVRLRDNPGDWLMIIISIFFIILITATILYSLCLITSKTCLDVHSKSLVFADAAEARRFEALLSEGDTESIYRILKALQQRREIDITESEREIFICEHPSAPVDHLRNIFRDLIASDYDPVEDLRHLSVMSRFHPDLRLVDADKGISVSGFMPVPADNLENVTDDLFASEYDIGELLGNLSLKPGKESGSGIAFQRFNALNCA